jgi:hypothetical protein
MPEGGLKTLKMCLVFVKKNEMVFACNQNVVSFFFKIINHFYDEKSP